MQISELKLICELGLVYSLAAFGVFFTFRVLRFTDLTCDGSFVLGAATFAILYNFSSSFLLALTGAVICGALAGFATGVFNIYFGIKEVLSGIITSFMLFSINLRIMGGVPNIILKNTAIKNNLLLLCVIVLFAVVILRYFFLTHFGLALRGFGINKSLAQNLGIDPKKYLLIGLIFANALIAFSGAMFVLSQSFADISIGSGTLICGLVAILLAERFMKSWLSTQTIFLGITFGSVLYRLLFSLALRANFFYFQNYDLNLLTGILILLITKNNLDQESC